jgi:hypothetical protein
MKFLFFSAFFLIATTLFSQDYIIKKNGEKLEVSVKEISSSLISYRNFSQPNGPDRVIEISKVKEIIYADAQFEKFDTPKPVETVELTPAQTQPDREIPLSSPEEDLRSKLRRDPIMKSGLAVEGIFGATISASPITYVSLNVKLANKWYFNQNDQWRTGLQVNWLRVGINVDPSDFFLSLLLGPKTFSPLNIGWANVFRLKENRGLEANITGGGTVGLDILDGFSMGGYSINPEVKLRMKKLSLGLDYMLFGDLENGDIWNTIGFSIGAKF